MQEVFYEESAVVSNEKFSSAKFNVFNITSKIFYAIFTLSLGVILWFISGGSELIAVILLFIPSILCLLTGIFLGRTRDKLYVDYDYTFVSGSIRISKVIKRIKRKFVIEFSCSSIERLGKYDSPTYKKYEMMANINKMILTSNIMPLENKDFYYIVINKDGSKKLLVFECTKTFMLNVMKFTNRFVIEEKFSL